MDELVTIKKTVIGSDEVNAVDARELHEFMEIGTRFDVWIERRIKEYEFIINSDFCSFVIESSGGRPSTEYHISIDMAKELAMVERNEKGKQARQYFIQCEKELLNQRKQEPQSELEEIVKVKLITTEYLRKMLNYSEPSVLKIVYDIHKEHGISTQYLPNYVENKKVVFSLTDLLSKHDIKMSTMSFNKLLEANGIIETKTRKSRSTKSGTKTFKALTPFGLQFGRNDSSPHNKNEVQPLYFEDTFDKLLSILSFKAAA